MEDLKGHVSMSRCLGRCGKVLVAMMLTVVDGTQSWS